MANSVSIYQISVRFAVVVDTNNQSDQCEIIERGWEVAIVKRRV